MKNNKFIKIKLIRSIIGYTNRNKIITNCLGLKKIGQTKTLEYNNYNINMIYKIYHLLHISGL